MKNFDIYDTVVIRQLPAGDPLENATGIIAGKSAEFPENDHYIILLDTPYKARGALAVTMPEACVFRDTRRSPTGEDLIELLKCESMRTKQFVNNHFTVYDAAAALVIEYRTKIKNYIRQINDSLDES